MAEADKIDSLATRLIAADGQRFALSAGRTLRIGRSADNDIVTPDKSVSRHHATIDLEDGRCTIHDLKSQNGTFVGGRRISSAELRNGDRLRFGELEFSLSNPAEPQTSPESPSLATTYTPTDAPRWWQPSSVRAIAIAGAITLSVFAILALGHRHQRPDQAGIRAREQERIGLASLTAGGSNFELPNASSAFVGDWAGTVQRTNRIPLNVVSDPALDEGIGFYQSNGQVVMSVASYVHPGVTVASMKARALDPSHVLLEEEYVQKDSSGQPTFSYESVEYSPSSSNTVDCKVIYTYYRDPRAQPFAKLIFEGVLNRVSAQDAAKQTEAIKAKGFVKDRELQARLPKD